MYLETASYRKQWGVYVEVMRSMKMLGENFARSVGDPHNRVISEKDTKYVWKLKYRMCETLPASAHLFNLAFVCINQGKHIC